MDWTRAFDAIPAWRSRSSWTAGTMLRGGVPVPPDFAVTTDDDMLLRQQFHSVAAFLTAPPRGSHRRRSEG